MLDYLTKEDLPQCLVDIEEVIGIENVIELIRLAGGSSIYIPSENSVLRNVRNKIIKEDFKGNYRELSRRFGLSEVQVRNIVNLDKV